MGCDTAALVRKKLYPESGASEKSSVCEGLSRRETAAQALAFRMRDELINVHKHPPHQAGRR